MAGSERVRETDYLPFLILGLEITLFTLLRIKWATEEGKGVWMEAPSS